MKHLGVMTWQERWTGKQQELTGAPAGGSPGRLPVGGYRGPRAAWLQHPDRSPSRAWSSFLEPRVPSPSGLPSGRSLSSSGPGSFPSVSSAMLAGLSISRGARILPPQSTCRMLSTCFMVWAGGEATVRTQLYAHLLCDPGLKAALLWADDVSLPNAQRPYCYLPPCQ